VRTAITAYECRFRSGHVIDRCLDVTLAGPDA
jgi:hypothetical protein